MKEMKTLAKKAVLMGLGLGIVTKQKAKQTALTLLKAGQGSEKEMKELANKIMTEAKKKERFVKALVEGEVKVVKAKAENAVKKLKTNYEKQLKALQQRVKAAEAKAMA
ncbi:MAG: hypothetical protein L6266_01660 [Nanoarchaeota archaeon]|nr:hypothetical protein [Nanoarchaeota archaeon]